jgi:RsiW-degrading membrane proteinase PrsW (M82 family)
VTEAEDRSVHSPGLPQFKDQRTVYGGIAIWTGLLLAALVLRDDLEAEGRGWWIWAAVTGIVLGLVALGYIRGRAVLSERKDD